MNFIDLINPQVLLRDFNLIRGNAAGQEANLRVQEQQANALELSRQIQQFNNAFAFENAARAAQTRGFTGADQFNQASLLTNNPFASLQATNAAASINQVNLAQTAAQQNLLLNQQLLGAQNGVNNSRNPFLNRGPNIFDDRSSTRGARSLPAVRSSSTGNFASSIPSFAEF